MKQETLEEAAVDYISEKSERAREYEMVFNAIRFGAKWQAERTYSEEDLREAFSGGRTVYNYKSEWEETYNDNMTSSKFENFTKWFEQFKKK